MDDLDALEPLGDAERGRLLTSLLQYSRTGAAEELRGNERFLFPMFRARIDRDFQAYEEKCTKNSENIQKRWENSENRKAGQNLRTDSDASNRIQPNTTVYESYQEEEEEEAKKKQSKEKEKEKEKEAADKPPRSRFAPPNVEDVRAYCLEKGYDLNDVDPEAFVNFYASKGWCVGKSPMKDWRAAVRTWVNRHKADKKGGNEVNPEFKNIPGVKYL